MLELENRKAYEWFSREIPSQMIFNAKKPKFVIRFAKTCKSIIIGSTDLWTDLVFVRQLNSNVKTFEIVSKNKIYFDVKNPNAQQKHIKERFESLKFRFISWEWYQI